MCYVCQRKGYQEAWERGGGLIKGEINLRGAVKGVIYLTDFSQDGFEAVVVGMEVGKWRKWAIHINHTWYAFRCVGAMLLQTFSLWALPVHIIGR